jgi:site-specific recombinase XerD
MASASASNAGGSRLPVIARLPEVSDRDTVQLRHAHAVELAREDVVLNVIQRQLGHATLGTTSIYPQGIDPEEIVATVHMRDAPMMSASAGLRF